MRTYAQMQNHQDNQIGTCDQEVLGVVEASLEDFDAVCMATALSKMANLKATPNQVDGLAVHPQLDRLKRRIGESDSTSSNYDWPAVCR